MPENITRDMLSLAKGFEVIEAQMDRWRRASEAHETWSELAALCVQFFEGQQWSPQERAKLADEGRPCITKNKIAPIVRLLLGYFRQNRYDSVVKPGNDGRGTQEIADTLTSVLKQIAESNQSDWVDSQVMQDGLQTGRGFWDVRLDFSKNYLGTVKSTCLDPFSVYIDPEGDSYDSDEWQFAIVNRWMSPADIFLLYGERGLSEVNGLGTNVPITTAEYMNNSGSMNDFSPGRYFAQTESYFDDGSSAIRLYSSPSDHINRFRKLVRVLDCQHRLLKRCRYFVDLSTGQEKMIPEDWPREKKGRVAEWARAKGLTIVPQERLRKVVRWTVTAGDRVLHDEWSPYDFINIYPYFPYFRRGKTRGMIEDLLDPQREINKRSAAQLHIIMSAANSGWMYEDGSLSEDMEEALESHGATPGIHIKYLPGRPEPRRIEPGAPPMAMERLIQQGESDLKEISGINDSALGSLDRVQSGRAIQARQQQSIIGAEIYFDNFARSKELKCRKELSIVQAYYTEPRIIRVRSGEGGQDQQTEINRVNAAGEIINNVTYGTYDVAIDATPISSTFMQGQFQEAMDLLEQGVPIPPDILIDLSSMPNKERIKQRIDEQRLIDESNKRLESLGMRAQAGVPMGQPVPPVAVDSGPSAVVVPSAPQMPMQGPVSGPTVPQPAQEAMVAPLPPLEATATI